MWSDQYSVLIENMGKYGIIKDAQLVQVNYFVQVQLLLQRYVEWIRQVWRYQKRGNQQL